MNEYFIKGNVPSLKNSKQWTGKLLISSKRVLEYERATRNQYQTAAPFIMNEFFGIFFTNNQIFHHNRTNMHKNYLNPNLWLCIKFLYYT